MIDWSLIMKLFSSYPSIGHKEKNCTCKSYIFFQWDDDQVRFVLDQHVKLDFYSASSLKQQSAGRHVAPLWNIIPIPSQQVFAFSL
jgi:hypothetical protein